MPLATVNPATGETVRTFEALTPKQLGAKLEAAHAAFLSWRETPFSVRSKAMAKAAELLEGEKDRWAHVMVEEMGKPIASARAEVSKCAWVCRLYAEQAEGMLADVPVDTGGPKSFVRNLPLGPVLAVMPWNFPFLQVFRFVGPALMAGNVGLLKHASNVPQCALGIEDILKRAGFPGGVFQTLMIGSDAVQGVLEDRRVVAATLTGSEPAGASVASIAGRALKKTLLELGGSDPFIVLPSANLDAAAKTAVTARNINNGQSCIAAKRFIVHQDVYDAFEKRFLVELEKLKVGDPKKDDTDIGPLATPQIRDEVEAQVQDALTHGAQLLAGGRRIGERGNFYAPTVLAHVPKTARAYREEVFGPVALLFRVKDADEALALANDSDFGLGSCVWTTDAAEQERFVNGLEAGMTFVNSMVASDPRLPFGGVKRSGYGRELAKDGILEFVNRKAISIAKPG